MSHTMLLLTFNIVICLFSGWHQPTDSLTVIHSYLEMHAVLIHACQQQEGPARFQPLLEVLHRPIKHNTA